VVVAVVVVAHAVVVVAPMAAATGSSGDFHSVLLTIPEAVLEEAGWRDL